MKSAHVALSHAKPKGSGAVAIFDRRMDDEVQLRRQVEQRVREALATDSFDLHFQPVMAGPTGRLLGFEALLRLPDGPGGFVSPAVFVPVAEEIGLISAIGAFVLRRACQCAAGWPEHLTVAVNLSPEQFRDGSAVTAVRAALARSGLKPHRLELEITESLLLADSEAVLADLAELQAMGVAIVMDDFGTGYSSLSYLWKFPFAKVKIDRSFLRGLDGRDASAFRGTPVDGILRAVLSLSRSLRLRVTAEGVETEAQAAFLRDLGCDELQGFLFGRPMPAGEADALALRDRRWGGEPAVVALHAVR
jgi:EAL domain-containing protein (putative c-di-GMP-specific phosphodiesterase class I)